MIIEILSSFLNDINSIQVALFTSLVLILVTYFIFRRKFFNKQLVNSILTTSPPKTTIKTKEATTHNSTTTEHIGLSSSVPAKKCPIMKTSKSFKELNSIL